jgi:two-component system sensor histidine kinase HydH
MVLSIGNDLLGGFCVPEPRRHGRKRGYFFRVYEGVDCTTTGVSANDHVRDVQRAYGILDRRGHTAGWIAMRGNQISRIATDEQIARPRLENQFGNNSRIRTGDEQRTRRLPGGQLLIKTMVSWQNGSLKRKKALVERTYGAFQPLDGMTHAGRVSKCLANTSDRPKLLETMAFPVFRMRQASEQDRFADHLSQRLPYIGQRDRPLYSEEGQNICLKLQSITKPAQLTGIAGVLLLIALAQHFTPADLIHWHFIWERLYYIPIITSGLLFGWRVGLGSGVTAGALHLVFHREKMPVYDGLDSYLDVAVFGLVGLLTGVLSDRERQQRRMVEATSAELEALYRQLQANYEQMKRADRMAALGHISAGLAHEIRNPLAAIDGAASILQRRAKDNGSDTEFLDIVQVESRRLNKLLTNFIDFARPRSPDLRSASVEELFDSTIVLASHAVREGAIHFKKSVQSEASSLLCDPEQMKQVLLNLTLNAVHAMPERGEISFSADHEGNELVIRVRDHGSGIRQEDADSIFDPFFTTKENGTGLGLSVAYQIVEQHGGRLQLESNSPRGATFAVRLPYPRNSL